MNFDAIHVPITPEPPPSTAVEMQRWTAFGGKISDEARVEAARMQAERERRAPPVVHGLDERGRAYRRLTEAELRDVEREDARERLRSHLQALRQELAGRPTAAYWANVRNAKNAFRAGDPDYTPEHVPTEAEVQTEIDRVQRELELLG